ncbi:MAG: cellulase family glycosylhydrolase [Fibrobacter sp.]|nr:cellulase family glycosylhydrolase [Fibrobacter sp.]
MSIAKKMTGVLLAASLCSFAGPVSHFGKLVACGSDICGEKTGTSTPIQLKGPSLFWSTGSPAALFNPITVDWFTANFNIGVIRAPMAIKYYDANCSDPLAKEGLTSYGYLSGGKGDKENTKALIKSIVDAAIANDIYVIVDWHSHCAEKETSEAANFFKEMATEYKDVPNLIWEIYNEPVGASASTINDYAKTVTAAIRGTGNENLVIVGTNFYSSKPNEQASQGLHNTYKNVGYSLHFYAAANHNSYQSNKASGAPTFVTEWGATGADGDGGVSDASGWRSWMDQNKVSGCMWFAGPDKQSSAMFPEGASTANLDSYLDRFSGTSTSAGVFKAFMSTNSWTSFVPSSHPMGKTITASIKEGASKTFSSTDLGIRGTISEATVAVGTVTKTDNSITFQSPEYGSPEKIAISYSVTSGDVTTKERIVVTITDRKPILKDTTIAVSYKNTTRLTLAKLGASNPLTKGSVSGLSLVSAQVSGGTAATSGDTVVFTPAGQGPVELTYSVKNSNGTATGKVTLLCQNMVPTIYAKANMGSKPNTAPVEITLVTMRANDADGDEVRFRVGYLDPNFTGTLTMNEDSTKLIYTPDGAHTGSVTILSVLTDGIADSKIGTAVFTLTGSGTAINVTAPTTIPNYEPITAIRQLVAPVTISSIKVTRGDIYLGLVQSGRVMVDIYSVKGKRIMNLVNQDLSAGMHSIGWNASSIPAGTYIVRMRQGSTVKTQWFVNR